MLTTVAVLGTLGFISWLVYRAIRGRPLRANHITYGIAIVTGVYTYAFFLGMNVPQLIKVVVSIILGIGLIILASYLQRRRGEILKS
ncbi:MAG: hypothetical protein HYX84_03850 [Chloroflexi bacterium]|nr:hypothetical protein [Chloroflexota bacterium]